MLQRYIERYGDRSIGELKLETVTPREDPSFLLQILRSYVDRDDLDPDRLNRQEQRRRRDAERMLEERGVGRSTRVSGPITRVTRMTATSRGSLPHRAEPRQG